MTEQEWLEGSDLQEMVKHLREHHGVTRTKVGKRRLRLFCCACVRRVSRPTDAPHLQAAVLVAERYAEGLAGKTELKRAERGALPVKRSCSRTELLIRETALECLYQDNSVFNALYCAETAARVAADRSSGEWNPAGPDFERNLSAYQKLYADEAASQPDLLREIFGNPFHPFAPRKFPPDVRSLAQSCDEGDAGVFPILADALADLGEESAAAHCRQPGHVKGCHVLDWVLGKK